MLRQPPDILITTPESLYLMLTSQAREILRRRRVGDRRRDPRRRRDQARRAPGAHARAARRRSTSTAATPQRIGLSATQNPLEEVGRFLVGPTRTCTIVDTGVRKPLDLKIHVPVESMVEPDAGRSTARSARPAAGRRGHPPLDLAGDLPGAARARPRAPLDDHLRQQPPRRRAARAAAERAGRRARSRAPTTARSRARSGSSSRSC